MTMLKITNLNFTAGGLHKPILENISYDINAGEFIILLGSNGSGKSSLLKLLSEENHSYTGNIHFLNKGLTNYSRKEKTKHIASLTQHMNDSLFNSLTIYENYVLVKKEKRAKIQQYLQDFNPNLIPKLDIPVQFLSGGEKQALALALRFLNPPSLLLLDEHTSALDPKSAQQIMQLTQKLLHHYQITCIMTTHDLDIAMQYGDKILMLKEGKIHQQIDKKEKQLLHKEILKQLY